MTVIVREFDETGRSRPYAEISIERDGEETLLVGEVMYSYFETSFQITDRVRVKKGIARLIDAIGIDNQWDCDRFIAFWSATSRTQRAGFAELARALGITFHQCVTECFLNWLEPVDDELDSGTKTDYDYRSERSFVMGENHSIIIYTTFDDYGEGLRYDLVFDGSDYPVRQSFFDVWETTEAVNRYVNRA